MYYEDVSLVMPFINHLQSLMDQKELSVLDIHRLTGLSRSSIDDLRKEKISRVDLHTLDLLLIALGCTSTQELIEFVPDSK